MDFLKKAAQNAKKLGNQLLDAVDSDANNHHSQAHAQPSKESDSKTDLFEDRDLTKESSVSGGSSCSLEDAEFEAAVKHFMSVNGNLKQLGMKAQAWAQSFKAQSTNGLAVGAASADACKLDFEDEPTWIQAADKLKEIAQLLDSKYTTQLCALIQRDILDPITAELETNKDTKVVIDNRRSMKPHQSDEADVASEKLHAILRRRRVLLAQCVTALSSHQYNYYVRLAEQFQTLQPFVMDLKKRSSELAASSAKSSESASDHGSASPTRSANHASAAPGRAAAHVSAVPAPQPEEVKPTPVVEADLLGMFGDSSAPRAAPQPAAPVQKQPGPDQQASQAQKANQTPKPASQQGDLLSDLLSSNPKPPSRPHSGAGSPAPRAANSSDDLLGFGVSSKPSQPRASADPLADFLGGNSNRGGARPNAGLDFMGGMVADACPRVHGDDEVLSPQKPRAQRPSDFKGSGTSRQELQKQFEAHVNKKAEAAAEEIRRIEEDKRKYEDLKFQMSVWSPPSPCLLHPVCACAHTSSRPQAAFLSRHLTRQSLAHWDGMVGSFLPLLQVDTAANQLWPERARTAAMEFLSHPAGSGV